jgi:hypothetical protein
MENRSFRPGSPSSVTVTVVPEPVNVAVLPTIVLSETWLPREAAAPYDSGLHEVRRERSTAPRVMPQDQAGESAPTARASWGSR